jgi:cytochrome c-type biogenesis protein
VPTILAVSAGPIALALTAGVIVAFNPCGFAMLPAYMSYFVGKSATDAERPLPQRLSRAALVAGVVTLGFVTVYGTIGLLATTLFSGIKQAVPFISVGVGIVLAILGFTMVRGYEPKLSFLKVGTIDQGKGLRSLYVFGLSYAVVSLSCGFAGFSGVVVSTLNEGSLFGAAATYLTFSLGMGLVLMVLTLAAALAQQTVARSMKKALPYINRISGFFLIVAGLYVAFYGYYSWRTLRSSGKVAAGPVAWVERWSASISTWLQSLSTTTVVGAIVAVATVVVASVALSRRASLSQPSTKES